MSKTENARAEAFLCQALDQFEKIRQSGKIVSRDFTVAGLVLRVEAAAGLDDALLGALAHLAIAPVGEPDLTVAAWDSVSTGTPELRAGWSLAEYGNYGLIDGFNDARFYTAAQSDPAVILGMLDHEARCGLYWTADGRNLPYWEKGAPFRPVLHEWLRGRGRLPVHGGAVGHADGGVFLAGAGGQGKSNVALACLDSELSYASDDFCVLTESDGWQAHSLYCTGKLANGDLVRHPRLVGHASNPQSLASEKALFFLQQGFSDKLIRTMPLKAIVMPEVVGSGTSEIVPTSSAKTQRAIAMSTVRLSGWTGVSTFPHIARFVRALPCFSLRIGADFRNVPNLICGLLISLDRRP